MLVCVIALCGCSAGEDERTYKGAADGRYGDALSLSSEVLQNGAIVREVVFDTRLEGWHYLGVTARAGETLTFELSDEYAEHGLTAVIGRGSSDEESENLVGSVCEWTPDVSGLVEVYLGDCIGREGGGLTVSGGYAASYYRAGFDRASIVDADGVIDGTTARIYLCGNGADEYDAADTAIWWRSAAQMIFEFFDVDFGVNEGCPIDIFVTGDELEADIENSVVLVPASRAEDVYDYDRLIAGSAWDVLEKVVELASAGHDVASEAKRWITALVYVLMTDNAASGGGSPSGIGGGAACLNATMEGVDPDLAADYAFANLMHSFGVESAARFIETYEQGQNFEDEFYAAAYEVYGLDVADFLELFGYEVSDDVRVADAPVYVPVQSGYTLGANASNATGTVVKMGESKAFDFVSSVVTTAEEYSVDVTSDHPERWSERGGIWYYTPAAGETEDTFTLVVTAGGSDHELTGKLTYDIAVGNVAVYEDVPYRDIDEAVDEYEELQPASVAATDRAEAPAGVESDASMYVLSVSRGSIQVSKTAEYEIHLRSRGVVRVDFGVPEYMFTMFRNSLTVSEYFGELYETLELEQGVVYDYAIYTLSVKGGGEATLGIREAGSSDEVVDIGKDLLIYDGYDRSQIGGYDALDVKPRGFDIQPAQTVPFDNSVIVSIDAPQGKEEGYVALTDGDAYTVYEPAEPAKEQRYVFESGSRIDYFQFDCTVFGLTYRVAAGASPETVETVAEGTTKVGLNRVVFDGGTAAGYIVLSLSSNEPFGGCLAGIEVGTTRPECEVVPSEAPEVFYQGGWDDLGGVIGVNGTVRRSYGSDAAVEYSFRGEYIAVYCAKGPDYGNMLIYLDGVLQTNVDLSAEGDEYGCLVWSRSFGDGDEHTLRLVSDTSDDVINLDFLGVVFTQAQETPPEYGNLYYIIIIPAILAVVLIVCLCLDANDRRKRRMRMSAGGRESGGTPDDKS